MRSSPLSAGPRPSVLTELGPRNVRLRSAPRAGADGRPWEVELHLAAVGRGGAMRPAPEPTRRERSASTVVYGRGEAIAEWYHDGPFGLEQGFELARRPMPARGSPLVLEVAVKGSLRPAAASDARAISLRDGAGRIRLVCHSLLVRDARGDRVPAHMRARGRRIELVIDDADARYPLVVDPTFSAAHVITTELRNVQVVRAADLDGDGDVDALSASTTDDTIAWYENTDGKGSFGGAQEISTSQESPRAVDAADLDGDGHLDALAGSASDDTVAWYPNTGGDGTFGRAQDITIEAMDPSSIHAADLDGDGHPDVLVASALDDTIAWYPNNDGTFGDAQTITTEANGARSVYAADFDGDGNLDVVSASRDDDTVAWYRNTDGDGTFGVAQVITTEADGAASVYAADVDGDGDADVLSASRDDGTVAWYPNTDGDGTFGEARVITSAATEASSVRAPDLDGDGDVDVLSASYGDDTVAWHENTDGEGTFGERQIITATADSAIWAEGADVDGDGDVDVLSASFADNTVAWYANQCSDEDGDGACESADGCPADPDKASPGACGCGTADTDADGNGIADCNEGCPGGADCDGGLADAAARDGSADGATGEPAGVARPDTACLCTAPGAGAARGGLGLLGGALLLALVALRRRRG